MTIRSEEIPAITAENEIGTAILPQEGGYGREGTVMIVGTSDASYTQVNVLASDNGTSYDQVASTTNTDTTSVHNCRIGRYMRLQGVNGGVGRVVGYIIY